MLILLFNLFSFFIIVSFFCSSYIKNGLILIFRIEFFFEYFVFESNDVDTFVFVREFFFDLLFELKLIFGDIGIFIFLFILFFDFNILLLLLSEERLLFII